MSKIAIVTDSTAYIPDEVRKQHHIHIIPLQVIIQEKAYQEEVDLTTADFYRYMQSSEVLPTTSQPSVGAFMELFEQLSKNYEEIISIHLSSAISGTYQTAVTASQSVDDVVVHVVDSEISCAPQGYYSIEAAKMAASGNSASEILQRIEQLKQETRAYFVVDNLRHLERGGRLSGAQALVGSLLQIKPILHFEDKKIVPFEKVRTAKKALQRVLSMFEEDAKTKENIRATVIHANRREKAEAIKNELQAKYPHIDLDVSYFGPVIGTHLGEGSLGLSWCVLD